MDFDTMREDVYGAAWITLPPASWCCPLPA
jgi:hypothetical protein